MIRRRHGPHARLETQSEYGCQHPVRDILTALLARAGGILRKMTLHECRRGWVPDRLLREGAIRLFLKVSDEAP